jgi:hypothetical protein
LKTALMITAKNRPQYFRQTLTSWALAEDVNILDDLVIALGRSSVELQQRTLVKEIAPGARIWLDSDRAAMSNGMHRAIGETASRVFAALKSDFLIFGEEDVVVSSDMVQYMRWAAEQFKNDPQVLIVNGHSKSGQGWDPKEVPQDEDANQEAVRILPYMNAWVWGTWRDRWEKILEPNWDYECNSGGMMDSGYDWNIATRIMPAGNYLGVVPEASRSQNIGQEGGWAANEESWKYSQTPSFRETRNNVKYTLVEE